MQILPPDSSVIVLVDSVSYGKGDVFAVPTLVHGSELVEEERLSLVSPSRVFKRVFAVIAITPSTLIRQRAGRSPSIVYSSFCTVVFFPIFNHFCRFFGRSLEPFDVSATALSTDSDLASSACHF